MAEYTNVDPNNPPAPQTKRIWKTFLILVGITGVEFMFAFFFPKDMRTVLITIYIILTLFKAFFIVSEFMHLGHEVKSLAYTVVMPMIFVCWLIGALIWDANHFYDSNNEENYFIKTKTEQTTKEAPASEEKEE